MQNKKKKLSSCSPWVNKCNCVKAWMSHRPLLITETHRLCLFSFVRDFLHSVAHLNKCLWWNPFPDLGYTDSFLPCDPAAWEWLSRITGIHRDISPHTIPSRKKKKKGGKLGVVPTKLELVHRWSRSRDKPIAEKQTAMWSLLGKTGRGILVHEWRRLNERERCIAPQRYSCCMLECCRSHGLTHREWEGRCGPDFCVKCDSSVSFNQDPSIKTSHQPTAWGSLIYRFVIWYEGYS